MQLFLQSSILLTVAWLCGLHLVCITGLSGSSVDPGLGHAVFREQRRQQLLDRLQSRGIDGDSEPSRGRYLNPRTQGYAVNGSAIPDVDFDVGESYAGLLPVTSLADEQRQLYFWFFPSPNPNGTESITVWLNGGPGCSSMEGLLQENGPFLWQYGTFKPVANPYSWHLLTNMVWIDQPIGTGFSVSEINVTSQLDVAEQFLGFFKNFVELFSLQSHKVYLTGESYAGMYVPYIANAMIDANDTAHYNLDGIMIYDPTLAAPSVERNLFSYTTFQSWANLFAFNDTYTAHVQDKARSCGYTDYINEYFTFPPRGTIPLPPDHTATDPECILYETIGNNAFIANPCWDPYHLATTCPNLWDVLGYPGAFPYLPAGASIYFDRPDVKKAINAPASANWTECVDSVFVNGIDQTLAAGLWSSQTVLPRVIEYVNRAIIGQGEMDYVILPNATLLSIQNMTWHGMQGFQAAPHKAFYVPPDASLSAASGIMGTTRTERGLTYVEVKLCGHMVPQYQPSAAFRHLEFLLGRIDSLESRAPFTVDVD